MVSSRVYRYLPALNRSTRGVRSISTSTTTHGQAPHRVSLVSWNINAFSSRPIARAKLILNHILDAPRVPDIIFLQEVNAGVRDFLLKDERVRSTLMIPDAEGHTAFEDVPFATMTLLSRARFAWSLGARAESGGSGGEETKFKLGNIFRVALPSKYKRDALCIEAGQWTHLGTLICLCNVHFDSLGDTFHYRARQMQILADVVREPVYSGGIVAGDFNAISPDDAQLVAENGLVDAWEALHGTAGLDGATWGVHRERPDELRPKRLDKVAMIGFSAEEMEVLRPGRLEIPRPGGESLEIPWSDHCGLRCTLITSAPELHGIQSSP